MTARDSGDRRLRLGDAERDTFAEALGHHYVDGRIDAEALTGRIETIYGAEFRDQAEAALADLPDAPGPGAAAPASRRRSWLRRRGHGESEQAQPGWRPTPERFRDPTTDRIMRVWIDSAPARRPIQSRLHRSPLRPPPLRRRGRGLRVGSAPPPRGGRVSSVQPSTRP